MSNTNLISRGSGHIISNQHSAITKHLTLRPTRRIRFNNASARHASTSAIPATAQYHIPKRLVHIGVPLLVAGFAIMRLTDPARAPQSASKSVLDTQSICSKTHARDLDRYIKANLDGISDEHAVAWNKMYNEYKTHRKNEDEPARIEKENARLLAQYARTEENKSRSTKVEGTMATYGGNRNISHRPETVGEAVEEKAQTLKESLAARWAEAGRRLTKVTKGSALF